MNLTSQSFARGQSPTFNPGMLFAYEDPLDEDAADDTAVATTRRGLCRLALTAAETGARFEREGIEHDPGAWLLAPRMLFNGHAAIDACLSRENYVRATVLHGLSLGLDADPRDIDDLVGDDEDSAVINDDDFWAESVEPDGSTFSNLSLFTATLVVQDGSCTLNVVAASLALDAGQFIGRFAARMGSELAQQATIREGVDTEDPLFAALLSQPMTDMLCRLSIAPGWTSGAGLDLHVEQRLVRQNS